MFKKTYHATHPDMMWGADNDDLRDRYLVQELFVAGEVSTVLMMQAYHTPAALDDSVKVISTSTGSEGRRSIS